MKRRKLATFGEALPLPTWRAGIPTSFLRRQVGKKARGLLLPALALACVRPRGLPPVLRRPCLRQLRALHPVHAAKEEGEHRDHHHICVVHSATVQRAETERKGAERDRLDAGRQAGVLRPTEQADVQAQPVVAGLTTHGLPNP